MNPEVRGRLCLSSLPTMNECTTKRKIAYNSARGIDRHGPFSPSLTSSFPAFLPPLGVRLAPGTDGFFVRDPLGGGSIIRPSFLVWKGD